MGEVDQHALRVAGLDQALAELAQPAMPGRRGLVVADRVADVVHELDVAQPLRVEGIEALDAAFEEVGAFRGEDDAGAGGDAGVDIGRGEHRLQAARRDIGAHPCQRSQKSGRQVSRAPARGPARCRSGRRGSSRGRKATTMRPRRRAGRACPRRGRSRASRGRSSRSGCACRRSARGSRHGPRTGRAPVPAARPAAASGAACQAGRGGSSASRRAAAIERLGPPVRERRFRPGLRPLREQGPARRRAVAAAGGSGKQRLVDHVALRVAAAETRAGGAAQRPEQPGASAKRPSAKATSPCISGAPTPRHLAVPRAAASGSAERRAHPALPRRRVRRRRAGR